MSLKKFKYFLILNNINLLYKVVKTKQYKFISY